jgi:hypothetical protein
MGTTGKRSSVPRFIALFIWSCPMVEKGKNEIIVLDLGE